MTALAALGLIHYLIVDGTPRSVMILDAEELSARRHFDEVLSAAHNRAELQQFATSRNRSIGNESLTFASGATLHLGTPSRLANQGRVNANLLVLTRDARRVLYDLPRPAQIVDDYIRRGGEVLTW